MKSLKHEVLPKIGYGEIKFGISMDKMIERFGEPEEVEDLEDNEGDYDTVLMNYDEGEFSAFFEGEDAPVLSCLETYNEEAELFGKKAFELSEEELIKLMKLNGHELSDKEDESWGETRLSFESALIDFYFEDNKLVTINWGVNYEDVV